MTVPVPRDDEEHHNSDEESQYPSAEFTDSDVEELQPADFPTYFAERDGRVFHSHGGSLYPLPVDTPEQERMNVQHRALSALMGGRYPADCPIADVLAEDPEHQKFAMDVCTGTGKWAMEMAREFPHVAFRALDIVPIATRYPLPNVQFTMHDANTPTSYEDGTFDLIHARSVTMAVTSYPTLLTEVLRLLRPGGLFLSGEWGRYPAFHPEFAGSNPLTHAPALARFFGHLQGALTARGLSPLSPSIAVLLAHTGGFVDITSRDYYMPIGSWPADDALRRLGRAFRAVFMRYLASVRPVLVDNGGLSGEAVDQLYQDVESELRTVQGLVSLFHTVHARKT